LTALHNWNENPSGSWQLASTSISTLSAFECLAQHSLPTGIVFL
jgi:hypothetical protein